MTQHFESRIQPDTFAFADAFVKEWAQDSQLDLRPAHTPESPFSDGEVYRNPFMAIEACGAEWAEAGMEPDDIASAAIELGGEPKRWNGDPLSNLRNYAAEMFILRYRSLDTEPQAKQDNQSTELGGAA